MQLNAADYVAKIEAGAEWYERCARECLSDNPPAWVRNRPRHLGIKGLAEAALRLAVEARDRASKERKRLGL